MKLSYIFAGLTLLSSSVDEVFSFAPTKSNVVTTQLQAEMGRREMVTAAAFSAGALLVPVEAAFAEYVPRVDDMKQIYCKYVLNNYADDLKRLWYEGSTLPGTDGFFL